jgi:tetratricopeptide (TPR) repeat protein
VSSAQITSTWIVLFLLGGMACASWAGPTPSALTGDTGKNASRTASGDVQSADPAVAFQRGEEALNHNQLDEAERRFREVLAADPKSGAACANLGVVYMRRKQWGKALEMLHQAEQLLPQVAGIRLNIGLAYYRQNEFVKATGPFESVVRDQPEAVPPRYLLGLCYFFAERWADATSTLEPLWAQESAKLPYLYVLSNAAHRAGRKDLDDRASEQLIKLGSGSPEYRLFVGKYHLNQHQYDEALAQFQAAERANPKLPFIHFNLGLAYLGKQDYPHARQEFLKDVEIEPDLALNYQELGNLYWTTQEDVRAEKSYRQALQRNPRLVDSVLGLAKIYQRQNKYARALAEVDEAAKIDNSRVDVHYMRGQLLNRLGRNEEGKRELQTAVKMKAKQEEQAAIVPSPELLQDPQ